MPRTYPAARAQVPDHATKVTRPARGSIRRLTPCPPRSRRGSAFRPSWSKRVDGAAIIRPELSRCLACHLPTAVSERSRMSFAAHGDCFRLGISSTRPGLRAEVLNPATRSERQRESPVSSNQRRVESLSQRYIGGIVGGDVLVAFPDSAQHSPMTYSLQVKVNKVGQRQSGPPSARCPAGKRLADDRDHFQIEHLWSGQSLAQQPRARALTVLAVVCQRRCDHRHHRSS